MTHDLPQPASIDHGLRCPKCDGRMTTYERSGVLVDRCQDCRGIFLDRGELERIVDVEEAAARPLERPAHAAAPDRWRDAPPDRRRRRDWDDDDDDDDDWDDRGYGRGRREGRGGFFADLLDSFGD